MVDRFSEQMPTNSFWKTKGLNHCSPFTSSWLGMTHVFLEVSVLYKAVLLQVGLPRLHGVDGPLGVGDDAAHVVRLVVRAGVVRPSRVRLKEQLDSITGSAYYSVRYPTSCHHAKSTHQFLFAQPLRPLPPVIEEVSAQA